MRRNVGTKGIAVVRNKFDWDAIAGRLEEYFRDINSGK
jgi:glycosyltransferase involved in cell wall biosynthesis